MRFEVYIFHPGKMDSFYKKGIEEYEKRLTRYGKTSYRIIKKEKEWEKLLEQNKQGYYLIPGPSTWSSESLGEQIGRWELSGTGKMQFFIEEREQEIPLGIREDKKQLYSDLIPFSLSDFRLGAPMAAMVLYEQIYRGYRILHNHPYHK